MVAERFSSLYSTWEDSNRQAYSTRHSSSRPVLLYQRLKRPIIPWCWSTAQKDKNLTTHPWLPVLNSPSSTTTSTSDVSRRPTPTVNCHSPLNARRALVGGQHENCMRRKISSSSRRYYSLPLPINKRVIRGKQCTSWSHFRCQETLAGTLHHVKRIWLKTTDHASPNLMCFCSWWH